MFNTQNTSGISVHPCIILYIIHYINYQYWYYWVNESLTETPRGAFFGRVFGFGSLFPRIALRRDDEYGTLSSTVWRNFGSMFA
jgi:hypothetical protein